MLIVASEPTCVPSEAISVMVQVTETSKVISEAVLEMREEAGFCCTRVSMELIFVTTSAQVVVREDTPVLTFPGQHRMQSSDTRTRPSPFPVHESGCKPLYQLAFICLCIPR